MFPDQNMMWLGTTLFAIFYGLYCVVVVWAFFREGKSSGNFFLYGGLAANLAISWHTLGRGLDFSVATLLVQAGLTIALFALMIKGLSELSHAYGQNAGGKRTEWGAEGPVLIVYLLTTPIALFGLVSVQEPLIPTSFALILFAVFILLLPIGIYNLRRCQRQEKVDRERFPGER